MSSYFNTDWNLIGDYSGMNNAPSSKGSDNSSKWQEALFRASSWMDRNRRSRYNSYRDYDNDYNPGRGQDGLNQSNPHLAPIAADTFLYTAPQQGQQHASSGGGRSGSGGMFGTIGGLAGTIGTAAGVFGPLGSAVGAGVGGLIDAFT